MEVRIACRGAATLPINKLLPFQGELKSLSKENYEKLRKEIIELGFSEPISVWQQEDHFYILNGHQRLRVLQTMAKEGVRVPDIPVNYVQAQNFQEAKRKVLALASQYGKVESQGLYEFISENQVTLEELSDFHFPEINMDKFRSEYFDEPAPAEQEPVPGKPKDPKTKPGDLIQLGVHKILCGDSTDPHDVAKLVDRVDMIFTDPPYGVQYVGKTKDALTIQNDAMPDQEFLPFLQSAFAAWPLKPGGSFYVCSPPGHTELLFRQALPELRQCIVWVKQQFVMGRQDYHWRHESILYGWREGAAHYFVDDRTQDTVWNFDRPKRSEEHPTMKPVDLIEKAIRNSTKRGERVYDGFLGSGSTLMACESTGRVCYGIELDSAYVDVVVARWEQYTKKQAIYLNT